MMRMIAVGLLLLCTWGCIGPLAPCREESGPVTVIQGEVAAGQVVFHRVPYGTRGAQNNIQVLWEGQRAAGGPQIRVYATKVECEDFSPPPATWTFGRDLLEFLSGACQVLGMAGAIAGRIAQGLSITHGQGNPEILGSPPEYKLWVVGDPEQTVRYTLTATWLTGCG